jgi:hypothetical protein
MMELTQLAPAVVIKALSPKAHASLKSRLQDGRLLPYRTLRPNLRIRGLKPSILYVSYTTRINNEIKQFFQCDAEEAATAALLAVEEQVCKMDEFTLTTQAFNERIWCTWEDEFAAGKSPITPTIPYKDVQGNTIAHIIAYSCVNRQFVDINEFYKVFKDISFETNLDLYVKNQHGKTPVAILLESTELQELAEAMLLRILPEHRLKALDFDKWKQEWVSLNHNMIDTYAGILIDQTKKQVNFLGKILRLTSRSIYAICNLFHEGYIFKPIHITYLSGEEKKTITEGVLSNLTLYNITFWISFLIEKECSFANLKPLLLARTFIYKEELVAAALHPTRIRYLISRPDFDGDLSLSI